MKHKHTHTSIRTRSTRLEAQLNNRLEAHKCGIGVLTIGTLVTRESGPNIKYRKPSKTIETLIYSNEYNAIPHPTNINLFGVNYGRYAIEYNDVDMDLDVFGTIGTKNKGRNPARNRANKCCIHLEMDVTC